MELAPQGYPCWIAKISSVKSTGHIATCCVILIPFCFGDLAYNISISRGDCVKSCAHCAGWRLQPFARIFAPLTLHLCPQATVHWSP